MTDLGNPYQALGKETVRTSYEQSHKETCLKFSPTAWGTAPPMWGFIPHAVGENINQILFIKKTGDMELSSLSPAYLYARHEHC